MNASNLMADKEAAQKGISPDWLVRGILTKIGDTFDRVTGRGWKPSSSLATSELIERMKSLLDSEARDETPGCKFVPNNIKLKMQWNKFSTDSEEGLKKLQNELLTAAVDHINDKRYFTHSPLSLEIKPDYFSSGVRLLVSFDKFEDEEREAEIHVSQDASVDESVAPHKTERTFLATYTTGGVEKERTLNLTKGVRLSVGRTKENNLSIDDASVSKIHASLTVNDEGKLIVADTGSTNGTFVRGERISYGKAVIVGDSGTMKFGVVDVSFKPIHIPKPAETPLHPIETANGESDEAAPLADTVASLDIEEGRF
jgi:pSer/pThr/pTyr-binding forkhead associated (FHA) protein